MGVYLKEFSTHSEYDAYINGSGAILPNVSICTTEGDVHYNPYVDPCKQYDYVEIGGVKWATKNIGACGITDTGLYFQWGDISGYTAAQCGSGEGQKYFGFEDYKWADGYGVSKYNRDDGKTVLGIEDDAARANWGGQWRIPTWAEIQALGDAVDTVVVSNYNGTNVNGILCTDKTDSSKKLFFPAAGFCHEGSMQFVGNSGFVWSSSIYSDSVFSAHDLYFDKDMGGADYWGSVDAREMGFTVRAVIDE